MTVPGKGGRPRKWRTDADRVRAFRARQQGVAEPPLLRQAFDDGDELARTMDLVRLLRVELRDARRALAQAGRDLAASRRDLETERRRFGWLQVRNDEFTRERDSAAAERTALGRELAACRERLAELSSGRRLALPDPRTRSTDTPLPRAARRRLEREQRRKPDS